MRPQTLMTFNPPTDPEGRWVVHYFAPWLDKKHPHKAAPGELRWFTTIDGADQEVDGPTPFTHKGETLYPQSRTFIPSRVGDNAYLMRTNYVSQLQSLREPDRSMMLYGDFDANTRDDAKQVIPTAWVEAAQARWRPRDQKGVMSSVGVDVSRGGKDKTIIARRHGAWFDVPIAHSGQSTPDGDAVVGYVVAAMRDRAPVHMDAIGVGSSPVDLMRRLGLPVVPVTVSRASTSADKQGLFGFVNLRSELWWRMREALDPDADTPLALPPSSELMADLCSARYKEQSGKIKVNSSDEIKALTGRSPDYAVAYILALMDTPTDREFDEFGGNEVPVADFDPYAGMRDASPEGPSGRTIF